MGWERQRPFGQVKEPSIHSALCISRITRTGEARTRSVGDVWRQQSQVGLREAPPMEHFITQQNIEMFACRGEMAIENHESCILRCFCFQSGKETQKSSYPLPWLGRVGFVRPERRSICPYSPFPCSVFRVVVGPCHTRSSRNFLSGNLGLGLELTADLGAG